MNILVVGGGGREHAIIWKISKSPLVEKIYCAPGNGGISKLAECVQIKATDVEGMVNFAKNNGIDLVVVAPDDPLALGMVDALEAAGIRTFGPRKEAAIVEWSKAFSKDFMKRYNIPTAKFETFDDSAKAQKYLENVQFPIVVKADGLAAGKGVIIAEDYIEAIEAVKDIMEDKVFGNAGSKVVIEEFLVGQEVTVLAFTDGKTLVPMVSSQDHKRVFDNDQGLNTGGMGTFSPSRIYTKELADECMKHIFKPTIEGLNQEGRKFKGVIYFGLIITKDGPKVIEYNSRFGDPETQVILPRLKNDIVEVFNAVIDEELGDLNVSWENNAAVCVIMASGGYPEKYETGFEIQGMEDAEADPDIIVFHSGTKVEAGKCFTSGGRVIGITAVEKNLDDAINKAYKGVKKISFKNMHYRKDIGVK